MNYLNALLYLLATIQVGMALYYQFTDQMLEAILAMTWAIFATVAAQGGPK